MHVPTLLSQAQANKTW